MTPSDTATARSPASAATASTAVSAAVTAPPPIRALDAHLAGSDGAISLAFDARGNLDVSDCQWTYAAIERIDPSGMLTRFAGIGFSGVKLRLIGSIAVIAAILILETFIHIEEVKPEHAMLQLAILLGIGLLGVLLAAMDRIGEK